MMILVCCKSSIFQSTPSAWRETRWRTNCGILRQFQSTPSAWRETLTEEFSNIAGRISIHSLRVEGDRCRNRHCTDKRDFNPLPPRGGRHMTVTTRRGMRYFNPLPPRGGRPSAGVCGQRAAAISIHSLRVEGDPCGAAHIGQPPNFNPLPPRGGRLQ